MLKECIEFIYSTSRWIKLKAGHKFKNMNSINIISKWLNILFMEYWSNHVKYIRITGNKYELHGNGYNSRMYRIYYGISYSKSTSGSYGKC